MAREPSFPSDASIGASKAKPSATAPKSTPPASDAKTDAPSSPPAEGKGDSRRTKHIVAGAAIGIGSAAIVAALLYANRGKRSDKS